MYDNTHMYMCEIYLRIKIKNSNGLGIKIATLFSFIE